MTEEISRVENIDIGSKYDLKNVLNIFETIAPLKYAQNWDNVGLLLEPSPVHSISRMLLTNDLTLDVFEEAVEEKVDLIYSYHPPIFTSFKSLQYNHWKSKIVIKALEKRIAIYSPHTALDVAHNGVNDWLISCFDFASTQVVVPLASDSDPTYKIQVALLGHHEKHLKSHLSAFEDVIIYEDQPSGEDTPLCLLATKTSLDKVLSYLNSRSIHFILSTQEDVPNVGIGRHAQLKMPISIAEAIKLVKSHLGLPHLRLALAPSHTLDSLVSSVAVCAGSGASILQKASADLMLTGEMSHHDTLEINHKGSSVIFCEHSNSERGFLKCLAQRLNTILPQLTILVSTKDRDPISIV